MRWEDERWVKVYTRDTGEWLALGWEAQALFLLLLRKSDRAGFIHSGRARVRGLAALAGMPLDVVERAVIILLEDGCLRETDKGYLIPNFIAAQEAETSGAQRTRTMRERDRDKAMAEGVASKTAADTMARMRRRDATQPETQGVTRVVTPGVTQTVTQAVTVLDTPRVDESRRDEKDLPAPSSPAPRDELRLEQVAPKPTRQRRKGTAAPDPRHAPLVKALVEEIGFPWDSTASALMAASVAALLKRADERPETAGGNAVAEVVRRGRIAMSQAGYYSARSLPEFRKAWDRLAEPERPRGGPAPPSDFSRPLPPPERSEFAPPVDDTPF